MDEQQKLHRMLEMIIFLSSGLRYTRDEIAERFDLDERSVYRYIKTFRNAGFIIPKPKDGRYWIDKKSPYFREIDELLHFSREEACILQQAIHSITNENLLKQNLIKKLYSIYNTEGVADTIAKQEHSHNVHQLITAINHKQKVVLHDYLSANSNIKRDRMVEPFEFTSNYIAVWAYDIDDGCCKLFKNTRIGSVKLLHEQWEFNDKHQSLPMDVFRISSQNQIEVKLKLSIRACELLKEEYPLSENYITELTESSFDFTTPVCGFEGVGRFIMGLSQEIEVVYPPELKDFLRNKAKNILGDRGCQ